MLSDASTMTQIHAALLAYLEAQLASFGAHASAADYSLTDIRRMCLMITAVRPEPEARARLLARLQATPAVLPIAGGRAEFSFRLWRDLRTIAAGCWEPDNMRVISRLLRPGDRVIDVGAHVGHFSIFAAHLVGPEGRVVAVEPGPGNVANLRSNLIRNGIESVVHVDERALADAEGEAELFDDTETAGTECSLYGHASGGRHAIRTRVGTLDALVAEHALDRVDLVKIDAEGAELQILLGASSTLRRPELSLLVELHPRIASPRDVCELLFDNGLTLHDVGARLVPFSPASLPDNLTTILATRRRRPAAYGQI